MRHARADALDELHELLAALRALQGLVERRPGVFHRGSRAFLHFHEDPSGLYADVRLEREFVRHRVQSPEERDAFLSALAGAALATDVRPQP